MTPPVRVHLLGSVRATNQDGPLTVRGKTGRTVLARLALSPGSVVTADQLADALWGDDPPSEPSASLRSIISRLRTQLGPDAILTEGAGYRLDTGIVATDLAEVEATLSLGDPADLDPDELATTLRLWTGEPLADVAWTPVFEPERARIDEIRARLIDCYHEAMLRCGRSGEALADLERDAAAAPLRESTQLLLMRALDANGRTADALRAGDDYRRRLVDHTGLDPSPGYEALARDLLDRADTTPSSAETQLPTTPRRTWTPPDTPFVGRNTELERLDRLIAARRLVSITGPGGVGKTRLITEYMDRKGRDLDDHRVDMVALASVERSNPVDTAVAAAVGVEVSSVDVRRALASRFSSTPSILVLDNCEHVLASTRRLVEDLLRDVEDLHIVTTSRRRIGLADEAVLDIGPLEVPVTNASYSPPVRLFLDRIERIAPQLTERDQDTGVVADICRLLDGLPLALEIAAPRVAMFGLDGLRARLVDGLALPSARVADDDRRQATIESTVQWSLDLLSDHARGLIDELSVFPSWFDLDALQQVATGADIEDALSEILDSSLLVIDHQRPAFRLLEPIRQVVRRQSDAERRGQSTHRYLSWVSSIIDRIDGHWVDDDRRSAQQLIVDHRADLRWCLNHLAERADAATHGRFANVLARALIERPDIELAGFCRVDVGPSLDGDLARLLLAWNQGDHETSHRLAGALRDEITPDHELWSYYHWALLPVFLYQSDTENLARAASVAALDEGAYASMRAESVALWAIGLHYSGDRQGAAEVLGGHEGILELSPSGGFIAYTRAELVAVEDPELAIMHLATASREAAAADDTFVQRLTEVSQLVLLISRSRRLEASQLAVRLIPELIRAGTYPQAWTAMRHVAALLGELDAGDLGLLILDSAHADPQAPAVSPDALEAEAQLRQVLEALRGGLSGGGPLGLEQLWDLAEAVLRGEIGLDEAGREKAVRE